MGHLSRRLRPRRVVATILAALLLADAIATVVRGGAGVGNTLLYLAIVTVLLLAGFAATARRVSRPGA